MIRSLVSYIAQNAAFASLGRLILKAPHDAGYGDEVGLHRKKLGKTWVKFASSTIFLSKML